MSDKPTPLLEQQTSRRAVIKTAAYVTPAILTLAAVPAFAAKGSTDDKDKDKDKKKDK
jgi:hypothetical protein